MMTSVAESSSQKNEVNQENFLTFSTPGPRILPCILDPLGLNMATMHLALFNESMLNLWNNRPLPSLQQSSNLRGGRNATHPRINMSLAESKKGIPIHETQENVFNAEKKICIQCNRIYKSKRDLQEHISVYHERKFECDRCTRTFISEKRMKTHQLRKHSMDIVENGKKLIRKTYACNQCSRTYETFYNYKEHMAKHSGKMFHCSVCNKQLSGQSALSRHSKIHDKPHECLVCAGRFSSAYDLDCHFSYYHSSVKRFKCENCDRVLYNYSGKLRHERLCATKSALRKAQPNKDEKSKVNDEQELNLDSVSRSTVIVRTVELDLSRKSVKQVANKKTFHIVDLLDDISPNQNVS